MGLRLYPGDKIFFAAAFLKADQTSIIKKPARFFTFQNTLHQSGFIPG